MLEILGELANRTSLVISEVLNSLPSLVTTEILSILEANITSLVTIKIFGTSALNPTLEPKN